MFLLTLNQDMARVGKEAGINLTHGTVQKDSVPMIPAGWIVLQTTTTESVAGVRCSFLCKDRTALEDALAQYTALHAVPGIDNMLNQTIFDMTQAELASF